MTESYIRCTRGRVTASIAVVEANMKHLYEGNEL